jgi:hypothetical protein
MFLKTPLYVFELFVFLLNNFAWLPLFVILLIEEFLVIPDFNWKDYWVWIFNLSYFWREFYFLLSRLESYANLFPDVGLFLVQLYSLSLNLPSDFYTFDYYVFLYAFSLKS